jgi:segregation and condensation protein A
LFCDLVEHVDFGEVGRQGRQLVEAAQAEALGELTVRWTGADDGEIEVSDEFDELDEPDGGVPEGATAQDDQEVQDSQDAQPDEPDDPTDEGKSDDE